MSGEILCGSFTLVSLLACRESLVWDFSFSWCSSCDAAAVVLLLLLRVDCGAVLLVVLLRAALSLYAVPGRVFFGFVFDLSIIHHMSCTLLYSVTPAAFFYALSPYVCSRSYVSPTILIVTHCSKPRPTLRLVSQAKHPRNPDK